jgi:uncharacterized membrane protein (UPF0182 family)
MYVAMILALIVFSGVLIATGAARRRPGRVVLGAVVLLGTIFFFWFIGFWGEMLWFQALGYTRRFWTVFVAKIELTLIGLAFGYIVMRLFMLPIPREHRSIRRVASLFGAFVGAIWGANNWEVMLKFWRAVETPLVEPILHKDTGFYLFRLPFYDQVLLLVGLLSFFAVLAAVISVVLRYKDLAVEFLMTGGGDGEARLRREMLRARIFTPLYINAGVFVIILAAGRYLRRFHLLYSTWGAVMGPGWTDVHIRLLMYNIVIVLTAAIGVMLIVPALRRMFQRVVAPRLRQIELLHIATLASAGLVMLFIWLIALAVIPWMYQWLRVEPNEITYEEPYIAHNIEFTRHAFGLDRIEEREFPASERFTPEMVLENPSLFSNIRLWDWRALDAVYKQFQEIRLYYEFVDVDIDRYTIAGNYRQVMTSARELWFPNLPKQSQTFVNQRFKYTHGNGITLSTVSEFTPEGLPHLLIKDIPPRSDYPDLQVTRPQIYYGELTYDHVIVNTTEEEFDYPSGEENVYIHYPGKGGVQLSNLWRKFIYGYKFDGTRLFVSDYPTPESRIMFHRQIKQRVRTLAPFLQYDEDPYVVLVDGHLYWIVDAYTTSEYFPYSEPFSSRESIGYSEGSSSRTMSLTVNGYLDGINYIRNSVKVVIDAFEGTVDMYVFEPEDPLIQVWERIFPGLFKPEEEMPGGLRAHIRYPEDFLLTQGLVYAKYHMSDPTVFYNQEDLWIRATEKYYDQITPVSPYYIMWQLPEDADPEFVMILPFTPKNRQVMIGWIAGMCDGASYGRLLAYKFPKEIRVLGPQQVETKIDQDRFLSGQLTLWDQRGSKVIRGNVLAIPVEETLIYVEPIYLQAETAAYPELRLVAVMHGDNLSYAENFEDALRGLFEGAEIGAPEAGWEGVPSGEGTSLGDLIKQANEAFQDYLNYQGQRRFADAARALETLQRTLEQLSEQARD